MKLAWGLFGLLIAMCAVVVGIGVTASLNPPDVVVKQTHGGDGPSAATRQHPTFPNMDRADATALAQRDLLGWGWAFGTLQIATFVCCLAFGVRRGKRFDSFGWTFLVGGLIYVGVFTLLLFNDSRFVEQGAAPEFLGPFPVPTALVLFGMWPVPLYFAVVYFVGFNRWIVTPEDMAAFQKLVAASKARQASAEAAPSVSHPESRSEANR